MSRNAYTDWKTLKRMKFLSASKSTYTSDKNSKISIEVWLHIAATADMRKFVIRLTLDK